MKFTVAICVEVLSICASFGIDNDLWVIMNYICLMSITSIDFWYFEMLEDAMKKHIVQELNYQIPKKRNISSNIALLWSTP